MSKDRALQMKCEAELAKLLKVDTIDWDKQMVVAVWGFGPNRSSEKFEFVSFAVKGENLTVGWRNKEGDGDYSRPKGVALVERFNGKVLFSQK